MGAGSRHEGTPRGSPLASGRWRRDRTTQTKGNPYSKPPLARRKAPLPAAPARSCGLRTSAAVDGAAAVASCRGRGSVAMT
eukprot:349601-Chlamydomonas_euryale.AAC.2